MAVQRFGRYRILREFGRDATAVVYLARDPNSGRQVAIKVLAEPYTAAPNFAERFAQVVQRLAALQHPYVLPVLDHGCEDGRYFLVSRYMAGGSLTDRLDGRPMLLADVMPLLQRLAGALDAVHAAGLVHGDLNPDRVLFDIHGHGYLVDTGVALLLYAGEAPGGWEGLVTPAYMSPEQAAGGPIDGRSDVYVLGLLLFEMLTGRQPFEADTAADLARAHREAPVPQLSAAELQHLVLPEDFNQVMARALARRPEARYPTAGVLADAVRSMFVAAAPDPVDEGPPAPVDAEAADAGAALAAAAGQAEAGEAEAGADAEATEQGALAPAAAADEAAEPPAASEATPTPALALSDEPPEVTEFERTGEPALAAGGRRLGALEWGGIGLIILFFAFFLLRGSDFIAGLLPPTATPTLTATITPSFTLVPSRTPVATGTSSPTVTITAEPTRTPTRTRTPRPSATRTPRPSPSATATSVPPTLPLFTPTLAPTATVEVPAATDTSQPPPPPPPPPPEPTAGSEATPTNTPSLTTPPAPPGP